MLPADLLSKLDAGSRRELERAVRAVRVRKGQIVLSQGARGTDVFFIRSGQLQALVHSPSGKEVSLRTLRQGDLFGELAALDLGERSASVSALTDAELDVMSGQAFKTLLRSCPEAGLWLATRLAGQVRTLTERIFELSALDVRSRLHCELFRLAVEAGIEGNRASIQQSLTHSELANRIGTHREAVTRELGELTRRNIVKQSRRELAVLDVAALAQSIHDSNGARVGIHPPPRSKADLPLRQPASGR